MFDKLKGIMEMQKKMQQVKSELDAATFEVASPDGLLTVTMNGSQQLQKVAVKVDGAPETARKLEEAVKDCINRAIRRSHDLAAQKMREATGLSVPGL